MMSAKFITSGWAVNGPRGAQPGCIETRTWTCSLAALGVISISTLSVSPSKYLANTSHDSVTLLISNLGCNCTVTQCAYRTANNSA